MVHLSLLFLMQAQPKFTIPKDPYFYGVIIVAGILVYVIHKYSRQLESRVYSFVEAKTHLFISLALGFLLLGTAVFLLTKDYSTPGAWINRYDTPFAFIVGFLTVIAFLLTIVSIKGLFEKITEFESALKKMTDIILSTPDGKPVYIMGYYLTFGILTLGHTNTFRRFIEIVKRRSGMCIYISDFESRRRELEALFNVYSCDQRTVNWIREELHGHFPNTHPEFKSLDTQAQGLKGIKDAKILGWITTDIDIISKLNKTIREITTAPWQLPPMPTDKNLSVPQLFNWYNEMLFCELQGCEVYIIDTPDYHFIHNEERAVVFVPFRVP